MLCVQHSVQHVWQEKCAHKIHKKFERMMILKNKTTKMRKLINSHYKKYWPSKFTLLHIFTYVYNVLFDTEKFGWQDYHQFYPTLCKHAHTIMCAYKQYLNLNKDAYCIPYTHRWKNSKSDTLLNMITVKSPSMLLCAHGWWLKGSL